MKKCLSALLSVLLIFSAMSCMLLSVSAASLIDKIYLTGINIPAPDRTGDYFVNTAAILISCSSMTTI